ncbi:hypothetical protein L2E82_13297 [Cichorium intybus]|uniref:Uncharacterized protein n=1 Tax=Cichorium intybus TaxID=13427 RepID=A0ACB9EX69_CICIN|nr:hypothetical protein L2E82_13297 [Cichorium intybus]
MMSMVPSLQKANNRKLYIALFSEEENIGSLKEQISKVFEVSLKVTVLEEPKVVPLIAACVKKEFGDYQCNNGMSIWAKIKGKGTQFKGPQPAIMKNLPTSDMIESCSMAAPGFVNVKLSKKWIAKLNLCFPIFNLSSS